MKSSDRRRAVTAAIALCAIVPTLGCGQRGDQLPVYSVKGIANYNGKPMKGASIVLVPSKPDSKLKMPPFGVVGEDGSFAITSYGKGDGAPAGEYKVTFTWSDGDPDDPTDLLKGRFSDPRKP